MRKDKRKITRISFCLVVCCLLVLSLGLSAPAHDVDNREYRVKAAFVYNFARFTSWPDDAFTGPDSPLTICIYGKDYFGNSFSQFTDKKIKDRDLDIKRVDILPDEPGCQILLISKSEKKALPQILKKLAGKPILLVSDIENFADLGGTIGLINHENKIRFAINLDTAQNDNLQISSHLLKLGQKVIISPKDLR